MNNRQLILDLARSLDDRRYGVPDLVERLEQFAEDADGLAIHEFMENAKRLLGVKP
jgi:murein endopeptidase